MTTILTAEAVPNMTDQQLLEAYIASVLRGEDDSDFAIAARADLIATRLMTADDLDAEIDRVLDERSRESRYWADFERGFAEGHERTEAA